MGEFSITHLLLFGFIALLFFGPSRLEGLGKSLGRSIRGFKEGLNEIDAEVKPVQDPNKQISSQQAQADVSQQTQKEKDPTKS